MLVSRCYFLPLRTPYTLRGKSLRRGKPSKVSRPPRGSNQPPKRKRSRIRVPRSPPHGVGLPGDSNPGGIYYRCPGNVPGRTKERVGKIMWALQLIYGSRGIAGWSSRKNKNFRIKSKIALLRSLGGMQRYEIWANMHLTSVGIYCGSVALSINRISAPLR